MHPLYWPDGSGYRSVHVQKRITSVSSPKIIGSVSSEHDGDHESTRCLRRLTQLVCIDVVYAHVVYPYGGHDYVYTPSLQNLTVFFLGGIPRKCLRGDLSASADHSRTQWATSRHLLCTWPGCRTATFPLLRRTASALPVLTEPNIGSVLGQPLASPSRGAAERRSGGRHPQFRLSRCPEHM